MSPGYATFVLPIADAKSENLRAYLVKNAEPTGLANNTGRLMCQTDFPFDKIRTMHFCSFHILPAAEGCASSLVFEATFDGSRSDFLDEFFRAMPQGLDKVLVHCKGYPQSGLAAPALAKSYLEAHDAGANAFFSGSPGRTVSQIEGEGTLRGAMTGFLRQRPASQSPPPTLVGLQKELQREVVRDEPSNRWAEQAPMVSWEVACGSFLSNAVWAAAWLLAACLGVLAFKLSFYVLGYGPHQVAAIPNRVVAWAMDFGQQLANSNWLPLRWLGQGVAYLRMPWLYVLFGLAVTWLVVRCIGFMLDDLRDDPRDENFLVRVGVHFFSLAQKALLVALVGCTLLAVTAPPLTQPSTVALPPLKALVNKLDRTVAVINRTSEQPSLNASFLLLVVCAFLFVALVHRATSLKLAVQFAELSNKSENVRRFLLDMVRLGIGIVVVFALFVVFRHLPEPVSQWLAAKLDLVVRALLVLAVYAAAGALAAYALVILPASLLVRYLEFADSRRFKPAAELMTIQRDEAIIAREEGGTNRYQNYLGSMTYVKPGFIRQYLLRGTLAVIHVLSRFYFNKGELGQISTILSARWVLVDGGRRLLFLDNYSGSWESYLNEFIDMAAVQGLNAIWTNTFVKAGGSSERYSFPETRFYAWRGAQDEKPFKAYVRQSQIETLVWYSAYPTLSIKNVNTNSFLRRSLFEPMASHGMDRVVQHL